MLDDLGVGDAGVGHVGVHAARAVRALDGAAAPTDGLVVAEAVVSEAQVVHRALAAAGKREGLDQGVHQPLRGLDVAAHHGRAAARIGGEGRVEQPLGDPELHRLEQPLVERQVEIDEQAHDVHGHAVDDRRRGVQVARVHTRAAREVEHRLPVSDGQSGDERRAVVEELAALADAGPQAPKRRPHLRRRQAAQGVHVPEDVIRSDRGGEGGKRCAPAQDGGQHRPQIGEVVGQRPGRERTRREQLLDLFPPRLAAREQQGRRNHHPLFGQRARVRRYRAGAHAADLGMVGPAGNITEQLPGVVDRRHQGHVRQVRAAEGGVVGHHHVPRTGRPEGDQLPDAEPHGAEVDRNVGRIDHQPPGGIQQGAREVLALLDVGGDGGALQHLAHLARDAREAVAHQLELDRRRPRTAVPGRGLRRRPHPGPDAAVPDRLRAPARGQHEGAVPLLDQGRALDHRSRVELGRLVARHLAPRPVDEAPLAGGRARGVRRCDARTFEGGGLGPPAARHDPQRHDLDRARLRAVREELEVRLPERPGEIGALLRLDLERRVLTGVAQLDDAPGVTDGVAADPLLLERCDSLGLEIDEPTRKIRSDLVERPQHLPVREALEDGVPQPDGTEQTGVTRQQHLLETQQIGHPAGVLAPGAAEGDQAVSGGVDPLAHRDVADRAGHPLVGDAQQPLEHRLVRARVGRTQVLRELGEPGPRRPDVDGDRETVRHQASEKEVHVGQSQRPAGAVGGGAGARPRALRTHRQPSLLHPTDRAAAGRDGLDGERRGRQGQRADAV